MDFTFKTYEKLLNTLLARGFSFLTFAQYMELKAKSENNPSQPKTQPQPFSNLKPQPLNPESRTPNPEPQTPNAEPPTPNPERQTPNPEPRTPQQINKELINKSIPQQINKSTNQQINKLIILRHDVEARYPNALRMAQIEHKLGIKGSYYFRIFPEHSNEAIIKQIAALGHEIGYHYDDLSACKGIHEAAIQRFQKNLAFLRQFAPVTTITMEGAPLSKYDNRNLWESSTNQQFSNLHILNKSTNQQINKSTVPQPHYTNYAILAEPYFDLNFNQIYYLTDTGRCWDGHRYNVRDKATKENPLTNPHFLKLRFHTTFDLINAINTKANANSQQPTANSFPNHAMLNFHPQRWNDNPVPWLKELIWQNIKNQGKRLLLTLRQ